MSDGVVSLHGHAIPSVEVNADIVAMLDGLLNQAKSGNLQGFAYAAIYQNSDSYNDWTGEVGMLTLLGAISLLAANYAAAIREKD